MLTIESHLKINVTVPPRSYAIQTGAIKQQVLVNVKYTRSLQLVHLVIVSLNHLQPEYNPYEGHIPQVF